MSSYLLRNLTLLKCSQIFLPNSEIADGAAAVCLSPWRRYGGARGPRWNTSVWIKCGATQDLLVPTRAGAYHQDTLLAPFVLLTVTFFLSIKKVYWHAKDIVSRRPLCSAPIFWGYWINPWCPARRSGKQSAALGTTSDRKYSFNTV